MQIHVYWVLKSAIMHCIISFLLTQIQSQKCRSWSAGWNVISAECVPVTTILASRSVILEQFGGFSSITSCTLICCSDSVAGSDKTQSIDTKINCILTVLHKFYILICEFSEWNETKPAKQTMSFPFLVIYTPNKSVFLTDLVIHIHTC